MIKKKIKLIKEREKQIDKKNRESGKQDRESSELRGKIKSTKGGRTITERHGR